MNQHHSTNLTSSQANKSVHLLGGMLLAGLIVGCSSVDTHVNKAPVKARTFSFMNPGARTVPSDSDTRNKTHVMVQQALIHTLETKGVKHVDSGGDVTLAYLIIIGDNAVTTSLNEYFGYTPESEAFLNKIHNQQTGGDTARNYFRAGTLVVDIIDPVSSKLLQRRSIQAPLLQNPTQEARTARLQSIVDQMLQDVPISN